MGNTSSEETKSSTVQASTRQQPRPAVRQDSTPRYSYQQLLHQRTAVTYPAQKKTSGNESLSNKGIQVRASNQPSAAFSSPVTRVARPSNGLQATKFIVRKKKNESARDKERIEYMTKLATVKRRSVIATNSNMSLPSAAPLKTFEKENISERKQEPTNVLIKQLPPSSGLQVCATTHAAVGQSDLYESNNFQRERVQQLHLHPRKYQSPFPTTALSASQITEDKGEQKEAKVPAKQISASQLLQPVTGTPVSQDSMAPNLCAQLQTEEQHCKASTLTSSAPKSSKSESSSYEGKQVTRKKLQETCPGQGEVLHSSKQNESLGLNYTFTSKFQNCDVLQGQKQHQYGQSGEQSADLYNSNERNSPSKRCIQSHSKSDCFGLYNQQECLQSEATLCQEKESNVPSTSQLSKQQNYQNPKQLPCGRNYVNTIFNSQYKQSQQNKYVRGYWQENDVPINKRPSSHETRPGGRDVCNEHFKKSGVQSAWENQVGTFQERKGRQRQPRRLPAQFRRNQNYWRKNKKRPEPVESLLCFERNTSASHGFSYDDDDDDTESVVSYCSSTGYNDKSDGEFVEVCSEDSDVSDVLSSVSRCDSVTEVYENNSLKSTPGMFEARIDDFKEGQFVSVYWNIEYCPVPKNVSAVDIVSKIRNMFYKGHVEDSFIVGCNTCNLTSVVAKELSECGATVVHTSSQNKNIADNKLKKFLLQSSYKTKFGVLVIVTGDPSLSDLLSDMHSENKDAHIYIIFSGTVQDSLRSFSKNIFLYREFIDDVPRKIVKNHMRYFLLVSNLPTHQKSRNRGFLYSQVRGFNGKVRMISPTQAKVLFVDKGRCDQVFKYLQGCIYNGSKIKVSQEKEIDSDVMDNFEKMSITTSPKLLTDTSISVKSNVNYLQDGEKNRSKVGKVPQNQSAAAVQGGKSATLYVYVSSKFGDVSYWDEKFRVLFLNDELSTEWCGTGSEGYFLVKFTSVNKAQKAKKILEKNEETDAPKFLKLVKEDEVPNFQEVNSPSDFAQAVLKKITVQIEQINKKKNSCLKEFDKKYAQLSGSSVSGKENKKHNNSSESDAISSKIIELNEQKHTFEEYTERLIQKLQVLKGLSEGTDSIIEDFLRDYSRECISLQTALPVYAKKNVILERLRNHQVVIIQAETGSGKSTQICQYLWREGFAKNGIIVCTQPRKIAAMSLAKHVSSQVGCCVGGIVGYQVGLNQRKSSETKILYVTDFTMLKMCSQNQSFKEISCVVIDEAHERSIYTDLLLGMIKIAIGFSHELKIVITSATMKVALFQKYFGLPDEAVLQISGRSFPIEDIWLQNDVDSKWDYFNKTVNMAYETLSQEPGDVLAFLATPVETEKAVEKFNERVRRENNRTKILVYPLHGKLDVKEQQKVFEQTPLNARKVVFSTNCAETSVTIPGIRYVVDSGMVKEAQYDVARNLSILSIGFINKSSAEQRRGRAGRVQSGRCYRLYSRTNYVKDMADSMVPEILRVNLGQALLKLMVLGIKHPLQFDFVESPPRDSLLAAMKQLADLGAVSENGNELTKLGQNMAVLPLEPRLSHIIFKGIDSEVGYEAVVVSALATVSRNIFFRNTENKEDADLKKVRFCQAESDFLTYLEVYKEWLEVPKAGMTQWCVLNCINAKSMRLARDLVNEVLLTLSKELNIKLASNFRTENEALDALHEIIFYSFSQNICIFSGHIRMGYLSLSISEDLHIHPSSSLYSLGKWRPQFIAYDSILKTSQTFLINVTSVKDGHLQNALEKGVLQIDINALRNLPPFPRIFTNLGNTVLRMLIGAKRAKLRILENQLNEAMETGNCFIDTDFLKGQLTVFVPEKYYSAVGKIFCPSIEAIQMKLYEKQVTVDIAGLPFLRVVLGAGLDVKEILLPGEYRSVIVTGEVRDTALVASTLMEFGEIFYLNELKNAVKVTFKKASSAQAAVQNLANKETCFKIKPDTNFVSYTSSSFFRVLVRILRRPCIGHAFVNFEPKTSLPEILYNFGRYSVLHNHNPLKISVSKKNPDDLFIQNVPSNVDEQEFKLSLAKHLPMDTEISKLVIVRKKGYESAIQEISDMKQEIMSLFSRFTCKNKLHIDLKPPRPADVVWRAFVIFDNPHDGQNAVSVLGEKSSIVREFGDRLLYMQPILQTTLFCNKDIFTAIQGQIEAALKFFNNGSSGTLKVNAVPKKQSSVMINISSNNVADIHDAGRTIQRFIQGDQIQCQGNTLLEKLLTENGQQFLKDLSSKIDNSHVCVNIHSKIVSIFGQDAVCTRIKGEINKYLDRLAEESVEEISLKSSNQRSVLKEVLKKYGSNLNELVIFCGLTSAEINVRQKVLVVTGNANSIAQCKNAIAVLSAQLVEAGLAESVEECPVCCDFVTEPSYRLEYCGHAYCEECILFQLQSVDDMPVQCCKEGCGQPLVLEDIQWGIKKKSNLQKQLHTKAFQSFVKRSNGIKFCPSPDCQMVYRVAASEEKDSEYTCSMCGNSVCRKCCVLFHSGVSCEFYQAYKNDDDLSLKMFLHADRENRKLCPSCKAPIEKNGGCMHMTCWRCKAHICWPCLRVFKTGNEVYFHLSSCPARNRSSWNDIGLR